MPLIAILGDFERFVADDLYPLRYVITPLLALLGAGVAFIGYRRGLHLLIWRYRLASTIVGLPLLVVAVIGGNYFLSPLWERSFREEASPFAAAPVAGSDGSVVAAPDPDARVTHRGEFRGSDSFHFGRGQALIISTAGGHVLRFEDFSVRNGPDLFVYLSRDIDGKSVEEALNLGSLKATDGAFNYQLPPSVDLATVRSAVVFCRQFGVLFAVAPLVEG